MRGKKGTTSVKHDVKQYVRRVSHVLKGADEGAGTISGVALIAIVAAMLGAVAMAGNPVRGRIAYNVGQWNPARILCH